MHQIQTNPDSMGTLPMEEDWKMMTWWPNDVICGPPSTMMNHKEKNRVIRSWMGAHASLNRADVNRSCRTFICNGKLDCHIDLVRSRVKMRH